MNAKAVLYGLMLLTATAASYAAPPVPGKKYSLHGRHTNLCLAQVGAPATLSCRAGDSRSQWTFVPIVGVANTYMMKNSGNNQCLISNAQINNGALYFGDCNSAWTAAQWQLQAIDSAHYQVKNRHSFYCLDSNSGNSGGALTRGACNANFWSQHWHLLPTAVREWSWNPGITSDCHIFNDTKENGWVRLPNPMSPRCVYNPQIGRPLAWTIGTYNERLYDYFPGPIIPQDKIGPGKVFNFNISPKGDGTYKVGMAVDKVSNPDYLDQYTNGFFTESYDNNYSLPRPSLDRNLYADLRMGLFGTSRVTVPQARYNMSRLLIGVTAIYGGRAHYMEVVFWRDPEYDGCTATENWWGSHPSWPCDTTNLYDRRSDWGTGEAVYYYAGGLNQILGYHVPTLSADSTMVSYRLPISKLFKSYAWQRPIDWSQATISGIYMGIETAGKGRVWYELDNYRLYEVGSE